MVAFNNNFAATIEFPPMHNHQEPIFWWMEEHPNAHVLVAPCGTKFGKSFSFSAWLLAQALVNPRAFCVWIAPTYLKCRIGYRYMKAMLPDAPGFEAIDGRLEIHLPNGSVIKFLHGTNAEVTVEGEAVDFFVIDEAGKIERQLWYSLMTTITQTDGYGIVGGTPRGFNWFWDIFKKSQEGDPFFCWKHFRTQDSPYVKPEAVERARRILPPHLFAQYYMAQFVSSGTVFGDLAEVWQDPDKLKVVQGSRLWLHPDEEERKQGVIHGVDWAKRRDYTVFFSVNLRGQLVGFYRFRGGPYTEQVRRLGQYLKKFGGDQSIRYDLTGVGSAIEDIIAEADLDADVEGIIFSQKSKQEMVTRTTMAMETGFFRMPRIAKAEHEFATYEVRVSRNGAHSYSAPEGETDDIVSAALLAISGVYSSSMADEADKMLEEVLDGKDLDDIRDYIDAGGDDDFDIDDDLGIVDPDDDLGDDD